MIRTGFTSAIDRAAFLTRIVGLTRRRTMPASTSDLRTSSNATFWANLTIHSASCSTRSSGIVVHRRHHDRSRILQRFGADPTNKAIKIVPRKHNGIVIQFLSPALFFLPITFLPATGELRVQAGDNLGGNSGVHGVSILLDRLFEAGNNLAVAQ
jgi:hypothetical protein